MNKELMILGLIITSIAVAFELGQIPIGWLTLGVGLMLIGMLKE